ncbi:SRPBCC family protein [Ketobacter nezhaii]|uniref:SRPBCC family protein n=1 Tax=Ketobacter sp. MCCC 1A13808 TaxID=2602738 RepID=UPI0018DB475A|nr:SRPBCC family protein [Ketobacter sp. MCCC 1A13808]
MAQQIVAVQRYRKPVSEVFSFFADHQNLSELFPVPVKRIKSGQGDVNGVGSVRRIGPWPLGVEETVTAIETDRSIHYRISRNGGPITHHRGKLEFSETSEGSMVNWTIEIDSPIPLVAPIVKTVLGNVVRRGMKKIA